MQAVRVRYPHTKAKWEDLDETLLIKLLCLQNLQVVSNVFKPNKHSVDVVSIRRHHDGKSSWRRRNVVITM